MRRGLPIHIREEILLVRDPAKIRAAAGLAMRRSCNKPTQVPNHLKGNNIGLVPQKAPRAIGRKALRAIGKKALGTRLRPVHGSTCTRTKRLS